VADPGQNVVNPTTGETGSVAPDQYNRARAAGARAMTDGEAAALIDERQHNSFVEGEIANRVGQARGFGEAFGLPTDPIVSGVADLFGKGDETRKYLSDLKKYHGASTALGELGGQTGGLIVGGELMGGGGLAPAKTVAGRIFQGAGSSALRGGLENLVIGSTHDVNEASLGNPDLAGEKLYAELPKHFVVGFGMGGVLGAGGAALGEIGSALKKPVSEALDRQASAAVGREIGAGAEEGALIRSRMGSTPRSTSELADFLSREQSGFREAATGEAAQARSLLEDAHTSAAWQQSAKTEASRLTSAREAKAAVEALETQHNAAREALKTEHAEATSAFGRLSEEQAAAKKQLRNLAGSLDKVKGAELPSAQNIMRDATEAFGPQIKALPHEAGAVRPFSPEEIAQHEAQLGVTPVRKFEMVPLEHIEHQPTWEPAKTAALKSRLDAGGKIDPARLTLGENGKWVIEDGIHRTAIAREMGMTHMPAETTEYIAKGGASMAPRAVGDAANSLTPASPRAAALFQEWADTFGKRYSEPGKLTFRELDDVINSLDVMERRQRVVSGWGNDPDVQRAFDALKSSAKSEFDRASAATAESVSEAQGLHAARLRESIPALDKAVADAEEHLDHIGSVMKDFERGAAQELRQAEREGFRTMRGQEKLSTKEERILDRQQREELRGLPKPSKATPVDGYLKELRSKQGGEGLGLLSMGGAAMSLLHGNVAGAALSVAGGLAARTAKAQGNLAAARTMSALAESIAKADGQIAKYAGRAVGRYVREGAEKMVEPEGQKRPKLTFEKAAQRVREAQANPLIIEQRVRASAGPWATEAPGVYGSLLSSAQRAQAFLESKLPEPRKDPYSLTAHLEEDDLSDSEKYDFTQYAKAVADPMGVLKDVADGDVTPQQVEALENVYPQLYSQMRSEVLRRVADLDHPLDYEKSVNIGTLLNADTNEVMTGEFQSMLADMYTGRTKDEEIPGDSKPRGVNSRLSKSMSSASQQMQTGDV
jgi:hypothetical protein